MPGDKQMLEEFVAQLEPKLLGQLVGVVFDKMRLAGEAGSLLKIEEEVRTAVAIAKQQWRAGSRHDQLLLFGAQVATDQMAFDFSGITDIEFFEQADAKVIEALRTYAQQASDGHRLQRRLFSEDAVNGFAFVEASHKRFDVILMNPPFGDMPDSLMAYLARLYPKTKYDLATAFIQRAFELS